MALTDVRRLYLFCFQVLYALVSSKLDISELSEMFPSCIYHLEVDTNVIYKSETHNYNNSGMTWIA